MGGSNQQGKSSLQRKTFLLTCWQERDRAGGTVGWRFRLETANLITNKVFLTLTEITSAIEQELYEDYGESINDK
jgi:hypothetical protein